MLEDRREAAGPGQRCVVSGQGSVVRGALPGSAAAPSTGPGAAGAELPRSTALVVVHPASLGRVGVGGRAEEGERQRHGVVCTDLQRGLQATQRSICLQPGSHGLEINKK